MLTFCSRINLYLFLAFQKQVSYATQKKIALATDSSKSKSGNLKDMKKDAMSTITENCGNKANKENAIVALEKETGIPDVVEDSAAVYLLSVVRSILSSQVRNLALYAYSF